MKRIALICPNTWDATQLPAAQERWKTKYLALLYGEDAELSPATFDALAFITQAVEAFRLTQIDGVTSSSDYPGCLVAAAVARELQLPGPDLLSMLRCSHKYYSRIAQSVAVPEATPRFALIDPNNLDEGRLGLPFPLFVKPVKSWFSQHARRVNSFAELVQFVRSPSVRSHLAAYVAPFNQLVTRYTDFMFDGGYMLAEQLLGGEQVTLEGYMLRGRITVVGIVDTVMYPGTISFRRFEYPSELTATIRARMTTIAARIMRYLGFDNGLFNIELFYNRATDQVHIIEINPRMCGQFADLMEMVNGTNTYEILLALAAGDRPPPVRRPAGARFQVAGSFALRHFRDSQVGHTPDVSRVAAVKQLYPVTLVKTFYRAGQLLSEEDQGDEDSYRYEVVNMGGRSRAALLSDFKQVEQWLDFEFDDAATEIDQGWSDRY